MARLPLTKEACARRTAKARERYWANIEKSRAEQRKRSSLYRARNRDKWLEQLKNQYRKNKPKYIAAAKAWALANPDKRLEIMQKWNNLNRKRSREHYHKWYYENLEHARALLRISTYRRRAKMAGQPTSKIDFDAVIVRCAGVCGICDCAIEGKFHFDHIIPIAMKGKNETDNLQLAHPKCNAAKGARIGFKIKRGAT